MKRLIIFLNVLFFLTGLLSVHAQTWTGTDVGAVGKVGSDSFNVSTGVYALQGSGADIWGTADAYHFVYQSLSGDGVLTARVISVQNTNGWAKAGVMVRQDLTPGSIQGMTVVTPSEGVAFQYRQISGGSSTNIQTTGLAAPYWVRIVKDGSIVTSFRSIDGVNWTVVGLIHLVFSGPVNIGLCVCSHSANMLATATFDNVSLETTSKFAAPMPWQDSDIGAVSPAQTGALHYEDSLWSVYGSGADIWGVSDAFHYAYEPLAGDGQISTEILGQSNTNSWAKAGLMLRQDLSAGSEHYSLYVTPGNGVVIQYRSALNGSSSTQTVQTSFTFPIWLKLVRAGSNVYASTSPDGMNWTIVGSRTVGITGAAYIGLPVCSHNANSTSLAVFANVLTGPSLLTAESVSDTTATLYWPSLAEPDLVADYAVLRNGVQVATTTGTSYEDVQLTPSTTYSYLIQALDGNGHILATSSTLSVTTSAPLLPNPWQHQDIGAITLGGYSEEDLSTGNYTLVGSGADIWNAQDAFQFAWQPLSGDGLLIAHVPSVSPTNSWTKAGLMLRQSTNPSSPFVDLFVSPGNGVSLQVRSGSGALATSVAQIKTITAPVWLKLIRKGNVFTGYESADGMIWNPVGTYSATFPTALDAGLELTSHDNNALATAVFNNVTIEAGLPLDNQAPTPPGSVQSVAIGDTSATIGWSPGSDLVAVSGYQVFRNGVLIGTTNTLTFTDTGLVPGATYSYSVYSVNLSGIVSANGTPLSLTTTPSFVPSPWQHEEIGPVAIAGSASDASGTFTLIASGADIWNSMDSFGYIEQSVTGDGQISAEVSSETNTNSWTKAGPMIRATLDPGSPQASIFITPGNGVAFQYRTQQGMNSTTFAGPKVIAPEWLRLSRTGSLISAYCSVDGVTWTKVGQVNLPLGSSAYFGLAETAHSNGTLATSTFTNVTAGGSQIPSAWATLYFGTATVNPSALSPIGDGLTLLEEYQMGRDPLDYYQGVPPHITIVSGNNQTAPAAAALPQPLVISVTNASNQTLENAPVIFSVGSGGLLSTSATGAGSSSITIQTGSNGQGTAYLTLPSQAGTYPVNVSVDTNETYQNAGTVTQEVSFSETATSLIPVIQMFGGYQQTLLVKSAGTMEATGRNHLGQLGLAPGADVLTFSPVSGITQAASAATGWGHSLVLNKDGTVLSFGDNYFGQLGDGTTTDHSTPTLISGLTGIVAVAVGENYSVALKNDGTVWTFGNNAHGQLGQGDQVDRLVPTQITGLANIAAIASGRSFVLALTKSGTIYSWGANQWGQLGNGTTTDQSSPALITGLGSVVTIGAGANHALAINSTGQVLAWGQNAFGQVTGSAAIESTPQTVSGVSAAQQVVGGWDHSLILSNQTVLALGANDEGQLGQAGVPSLTTPAAINGLTAFSLNSGSDHAGVFTPASQLMMWGNNLHGQLGNGTTANIFTPTGVSY